MNVHEAVQRHEGLFTQGLEGSDEPERALSLPVRGTISAYPLLTTHYSLLAVHCTWPPSHNRRGAMPHA
jgi:hypothetical protein